MQAKAMFSAWPRGTHHFQQIVVLYVRSDYYTLFNSFPVRSQFNGPARNKNS